MTIEQVQALPVGAFLLKEGRIHYVVVGKTETGVTIYIRLRGAKAKFGHQWTTTVGFVGEAWWSDVKRIA
jgi:hypothetical protein